MTISEWNTCLPNEYSLEGTGLMVAYGLLQGWDGLLEFGYFSPDWRDSLGPGRSTCSAIRRKFCNSLRWPPCGSARM